MTGTFAGKTVLVTGGAAGLGRGYALRFGGAGAHIILADIDEEGMDETKALVEGCRRIAECHLCDMSDETGHPGAWRCGLRGTRQTRRADQQCRSAYGRNRARVLRRGAGEDGSILCGQHHRSVVARRSAAARAQGRQGPDHQQELDGELSAADRLWNHQGQRSMYLLTPWRPSSAPTKCAASRLRRG